LSPEGATAAKLKPPAPLQPEHQALIAEISEIAKQLSLKT
jgi:hypothetical protein